MINKVMVTTIITSWKGKRQQKVGYLIHIYDTSPKTGLEYSVARYEFITRTKKITDLNVIGYFEMEAKSKFKYTQYCDIVYKFFENNKEWYKKHNLGKFYIVN